MSFMSKVDIAVLNEKLEHIHEDVKRIREGVQLQNGRVRKLEGWKSWVTGGLCVISFLVGVGLLKIFGGG